MELGADPTVSANARVCPAGSYCAGGSAQPVECSRGEYSSAGSAKCSSCDPGTFASEMGQARCSECTSGRFPALTNSATAGVATTGAKYCVACPAGSRCDGETKTACGEGWYQSGTEQSACSECNTLGHYTADGNKSPVSAGATQCVPCTKGYACPDVTTRTKCPVGTFPAASAESSAAVVTSGATHCAPCPDGHGCDGETKKLCDAGWYVTSGQCKQCPYG